MAKDADPNCLHCAVSTFIQDHPHYAEWVENLPTFAVKLCEVLADFVAGIPEDQQDAAMGAVFDYLERSFEEITDGTYKQGGSLQ